MPTLRTSKLQEKPSDLKREYPALRKMKFLYFLKFFLFLWVIFVLLDPIWNQIRITDLLMCSRTVHS